MSLYELRRENRFLSTPSARRATQRDFLPCIQNDDFYPRPPRGGRPLCWFILGCALIFLSTPSARRATFCRIVPLSRLANFYPRPPRGGRHKQLGAAATAAKFLSTPSARRATRSFPPWPASRQISIHALREEGDQVVGDRHVLDVLFLSTPSARRATHTRREKSRAAQFLSTPSARRATMLLSSSSVSVSNFYPRPPRGGRHWEIAEYFNLEEISIHALREEGDRRRDRYSAP